MMICHTEILEPAQEAVLRELAAFLSGSSWHLGGGTALALHLAHRRSLDFDWFCPVPFESPEVLAREISGRFTNARIVSLSRGTVHAEISAVRVSFFEYLYPLMSEPQECSEFGVRLASLEDLGCMKVAAVVQRGARRDFVDLWALLKYFRGLSPLLDLYRRKYDVSDVGPVLYALTYYDDAETEPMPETLWRTDWQVIKREILAAVRAFTADPVE